MRFYFEPDEATRVAKCLGIAYICHSAYFVTIDASSMHFIIRVSESNNEAYLIHSFLVHTHHLLPGPSLLSVPKLDDKHFSSRNEY